MVVSIFINGQNEESFRAEPNRSGLINELLSVHYSQSKSGIDKMVRESMKPQKGKVTDSDIEQAIDAFNAQPKRESEADRLDREMKEVTKRRMS